MNAHWIPASHFNDGFELVHIYLAAGMTTAEAMGNGAVPVAIGRGASRISRKTEIGGFLWSSLDEG